MSSRAYVVIVLLLVGRSAICQTDGSAAHMWWSPGVITSLPTVDSLSLSHPERAIELDFDHTSSLYNWGGSTDLSFPLGTIGASPATFSFSSEARSELRQDTRTRTNEGTAIVQSVVPVVPRSLWATASLFGDTYSLNQPQSALGTIFSSIQRLSDAFALGGLRYEAIPDVHLSAAAGGSYKSFLYGKSSGSIFQLNATTDTMGVADGTLLDLGAHLDERRFPSLGEAGRNDGGRIHYVTAFTGGGSDEASVTFLLKRQDFYFSVDTLAPYARQERSDMSFDIRNSLHYPIAPNRIDFYLDGDLVPRTVTRSTTGVDFATASTAFLTSSTFLLPSTTSAFDLDVSTRLEWKLSSLAHDASRYPAFAAGLRYIESSQTNDVSSGELPFASADVLKRLSDIFESTSFDGRQSILSVDAGFPVAVRDSLQANFNSRLFRYDTPSPDNHDDRDELYLNASVLYTHWFSNELTGSAQLRLTKSHLVYLKSDRSSQNFVGKTISLVLGTNYSSRRLTNSIAAEVFSNYSVYDFPLPTADPTTGSDYLIRGVNGSDSIAISLGRFGLFDLATSAISANVNARLYERGSYDVSGFSERPLLRTNEVSGDLTFDVDEHSTNAPALVKLGARLFYQERFAPRSALAAGLSLQERISRIGPLIVAIFDRSSVNGFRLYGSVWYSVLAHDQIDQNVSSSNVLVEGRLGVRWTF